MIEDLCCMAKAKKTELGVRLKRLAQLAGLKAEDLSERLGVSPSAVWAWWSGRNEPAVEMLQSYAATVGVSIQYLLSGSEEPMGPSGTLQEWRLRFAELIQQGVDPLEAIDRITGEMPTGVEGWDLTPEEREVLEGSGPEMRQALDEASGGSWEDLSDEDRDMVLRLVERLAKASRPPPDDAAPG